MKKIIIATVTTIILSILMIVLAVNKVQSSSLQKSIDLGYKYIAEGNYEEAIIAFEKVISIKENNSDVKEKLNILYAYDKIQNLIANEKYDEAMKELEVIKNINGFEILQDLIGKTEQELDKKNEEIIQSKRDYMDGYWLTDKSVMQFKSDSNTFIEFLLTDDPYIESFIYEIDSFDYINDDNTITLTANVWFGGSDNESITEEYKIIDENTMELVTDFSSSTLIRVSQKEAVLLYYGKYLGSNFTNTEFGSGYEYRESLVNVYAVDNFEYNSEEKGGYTAEDAIKFASTIMHPGINKQDLIATEINILPGVRSYVVSDITNPVASASLNIFEGDMTIQDIRDKYLAYINN